MDVPNGRLPGFELDAIQREEQLLVRDGRGTIYALGAVGTDFHPERHPVVLVHGLLGDPSDLQRVVDRLRPRPLQRYVLAYDDHDRRTSLNGIDFAEQLRMLARGFPRRSPGSRLSSTSGGPCGPPWGRARWCRS